MENEQSVRDRRVRHATVRHLIELLTCGATSPDRIGRRVIGLKLRMTGSGKSEEREKLMALLDVGQSRVSAMLSEGDQVLQEILEQEKVNSGSGAGAADLLLDDENF